MNKKSKENQKTIILDEQGEVRFIGSAHGAEIFNKILDEIPIIKKRFGLDEPKENTEHNYTESELEEFAKSLKDDIDKQCEKLRASNFIYFGIDWAEIED